MAGSLLSLSQDVSLERIVQVALERGYTAQGEMFSAADMARLAEELFQCRAELLSGGLEGENRGKILRHLTAGCPLLLPYDEDSNHEPCRRRGYKAHWAVVSGQELAPPAVELPAGAREQRPADRLLPQAGGRRQGLRGARGRREGRALRQDPAAVPTDRTERPAPASRATPCCRALGAPGAPGGGDALQPAGPTRATTDSGA
ncbi:UPF0692 protein C19orf54 homolog isoform X2 [Mauremys reevesii]|uniref:UPF0692 protein C19orf54 homolog isoform X2 n=1 Tax=Mauremys reevesii TaxID=260615 RepID=UPI00193EF474|nr:UPF0692 protein C19orf54 homolog isoform X2 [Mauremys reevesii]